MRAYRDDLLSPPAVADPYSYLAELREESPVHWSPGYRSWIVTRHADVSAALKAPEFSSDRISPVIARERARERPDIDLIETLDLLNGWIVFRDPPRHTRLRRLVHRAFSPKVVAQMQDQIAAVLDDLLDDLEAALRAGGSADLIRTVAYALPAVVIAGMLGVPEGDRDLFKQWSDDISALVFGALDDEGRHARARAGMGELVDYTTALVRAAAADPPAKNLTAALVHARVDDEEPLSEAEAVAICVNLLFGGHETTTNLIANGVLALLRHPEQAAAVRADAVTPTRLVEEILRFDGPAKAVARVVGADTELRGAAMSAGDRVFLMLASANRDPAVYHRPDEFDVQRREMTHVGFGAGAHYCLGAALARLEAGVAIPRILQRFPTLAVVDDPELVWQPVLLTRGLTRLPVCTAR